MIGISQLSRAPEQRPDKVPILSDLSESGLDRARRRFRLVHLPRRVLQRGGVRAAGRGGPDHRQAPQRPDRDDPAGLPRAVPEVRNLAGARRRAPRAEDDPVRGGDAPAGPSGPLGDLRASLPADPLGAGVARPVALVRCDGGEITARRELPARRLRRLGLADRARGRRPEPCDCRHRRIEQASGRAGIRARCRALQRRLLRPPAGLRHGRGPAWRDGRCGSAATATAIDAHLEPAAGPG